MHFLAVAARLMRQILVDQARRARADKRGGALTMVTLEAASPASAPNIVDVLTLDQVLGEPMVLDARLCQVVGTPAALAFVDTVKLELLGTVQIGGAGTFGDLAVITADGRHVYATFDAGPTGTGDVAVVDVRRREVVATWAYPGAGRPHGIWYSKRQPRSARNHPERHRSLEGVK